ncbi:MAG: type II/IV secretion system protein [Candidatus Omnitrophica bacterium]|nr:type II/IV secretion system protein [Candidatus Omnitrophota bacterium]
MIVVIAIIAILAAIIAPNAFKAIEKASRSAAIGDFRTIKTASMAFYADTGTWPITNCEEALLKNRNNTTVCADVTGAGGISGWDGPYVEMWPSKTRWGGVYTYTNNNNITWNASYAAGETAGACIGRYIAMNGTPFDTEKKLDEQIDGTVNNTTGQYRWNASNISYMLISADCTLQN